MGNTTYCDYPEEAKKVQKVGDTLQPNLERILALRPQLVLVSTASQLEWFTRALDQHRMVTVLEFVLGGRYACASAGSWGGKQIKTSSWPERLLGKVFDLRILVDAHPITGGPRITPVHEVR